VFLTSLKDTYIRSTKNAFNGKIIAIAAQSGGKVFEQKQNILAAMESKE
jgi:hypothetical protein